MSYKITGYRKRKRDRDTNWSNAEKQFLQKFAADHRAVLDDRGNDTEMINKKNEAWLQIQKNMNLSGFYRNVNKLKQQWRRIKLDAKKRKLSILVSNTVPLLPQNTENQRLIVKSELAGFSVNSNHHSIFYASSENGSDNEHSNKTFNMINSMPKRYRSANWTPEEKQLLFQYIQPLQEIIDDKRNDTVMQARKKDAWLQVQKNMVASGFIRDVLKYKEQWVRMKFQKGHQPAVISANSTGSTSSFQLSESSSVLTNETEIDVKPDMSTLNSFLPSQNVCCEIGNNYDSSQELQTNRGQHCKDQFFTNENRDNFVNDTNDHFNKNQNNLDDDSSDKSDINHNSEKILKTGPKENFFFPQTDDERSSELHRYRIAVEKKRLKLLDIQIRQEQMLFQKEYEIKILKLEMMNKYKATP